MDDQDVDPIAEALSAVSAQFAGDRPPDAADALDAASLPYDDEDDFAGASPSDDPDDDQQDASSDDDDTTTDAEAAPTVNWDDEGNPYRTQAIQAQQELQKHELARTLFQRIQAKQQAEAEEADARALVEQLSEVDPQLAETFVGQRTGLIQRAAQAQEEKAAWTHSMAAMHMAMTEVLDPEQVQQIVELGREIVKQPGLGGMQQFVTTKRQAATSADKRVAELEEALRLALLQTGAKARPAAADRVDSAPAVRAKRTRPEDTDTMDDYWTALTPQLNAHFGSR